MDDDLARDLHLPATGRPGAAAVVLHPHPAMGGDRHHPLVVALAEGLATAGIAALRVDLTDSDVERSARRLEQVARELLAETGADRLVLAGYSWGAAVTADAAPAGLVARVLVAPPVSMLPLPALRDGGPALVLVPAHDQYGGPEAVQAGVATWQAATVEVVEHTDHFLAGSIARVAARAVEWVAALPATA